MKLAIGSDHAGFAIKEKIKAKLQQAGHEIVDCGTDKEISCDYPDFAAKVANIVAKGAYQERGILVCGTGIGMAIAANKIQKIRAGVCFDLETAKWSRQHNDCNVLCLGARTTAEEKIMQIVDVWLATPFESGRHQNRLDKIQELEGV